MYENESVSKRIQKHAIKRAKERYGVNDMSPEFLERIRFEITHQHARGIKKLTATRTLYEVTLDGTIYYPLYSKSTKEIITFLPPDSREYQEYMEALEIDPSTATRNSKIIIDALMEIAGNQEMYDVFATQGDWQGLVRWMQDTAKKALAAVSKKKANDE